MTDFAAICRAADAKDQREKCPRCRGAIIRAVTPSGQAIVIDATAVIGGDVLLRGTPTKPVAIVAGQQYGEDGRLQHAHRVHDVASCQKVAT